MRTTNDETGGDSAGAEPYADQAETEAPGADPVPVPEAEPAPEPAKAAEPETLEDLVKSAAPATINKPVTVAIRSKKVAQLLMLAITSRVAILDGLAKKESAEGYDREARVKRSDAAMLKEQILPQLQAQGLLALEPGADPVDVLTQVIGQQVRRAVHGRILMQKQRDLGPVVVKKGAGGKDNYTVAKEYADDFLNQFEEIVGGIAEEAAKGVAPIIRQLYESAFHKGRLSYSGDESTLLAELAADLMNRED